MNKKIIIEDEDDLNSRKVLGSILDADVYFGREYNGLEGKAVSEKILSANCEKPELIYLTSDPSLYTNRFLDQQSYDILLRLYENNQMIYMMDDKANKEALNNLEAWFIQIIEPIPINEDDKKEWIEREKLKLKGYCGYCDHDIRKKIHIPREVMEQVTRNYYCLRNGGYMR